MPVNPLHSGKRVDCTQAHWLGACLSPRLHLRGYPAERGRLMLQQGLLIAQSGQEREVLVQIGARRLACGVKIDRVHRQHASFGLEQPAAVVFARNLEAKVDGNECHKGDLGCRLGITVGKRLEGLAQHSEDFMPHGACVARLVKRINPVLRKLRWGHALALVFASTFGGGGPHPGRLRCWPLLI
ncbi:alanine transaminase [Apiospora arundinis]